MSHTGFARRGPLRAVVARHPDRDILTCGHKVAPTREKSAHRRCPFCPESKRAEYFRAYDRERVGDRKLKRAS